MMPKAQASNAAFSEEQQRALASIEEVADHCKAAPPDAAIEYELQELEAIRAAVERGWPLPAELKLKISIGPFAAKNIADWNSDLADELMALDYALQHGIFCSGVRRPVGRKEPEGEELRRQGTRYA